MLVKWFLSTILLILCFYIFLANAVPSSVQNEQIMYFIQWSDPWLKTTEKRNVCTLEDKVLLFGFRNTGCQSQYITSCVDLMLWNQMLQMLKSPVVRIPVSHWGGILRTPGQAIPPIIPLEVLWTGGWADRTNSLPSPRPGFIFRLACRSGGGEVFTLVYFVTYKTGKLENSQKYRGDFLHRLRLCALLWWSWTTLQKVMLKGTRDHFLFLRD